MDMFKEAESIACMLERRKLTQAELAASLGVSPSYIANKLRLLQYSPEMRQKITDSGISERHARALLRLKTEEKRHELLERIEKERLSVERTEALVDSMRQTEMPSRISDLEHSLAIQKFIDSIGDSVKSLNAIGIESRKTSSYHGTRLYITISIEEGDLRR